MAGRYWSRGAGVLALLLAGAAGPLRADCRLALVLAFDVSRSIDSNDYALQRAGLLAALADPVIRDAFLGPPDHVALAIFEWSSRNHQRIVVGWTEIRAAADIDAVAARLAAHQRNTNGSLTALGRAVIFGRDLMQTAPDCVAQVLDVSGDGRNNDGIDPTAAYLTSAFGALRINGLAIRTYERDVAEYYRSRVIRGPGAFVEVAEGQKAFPHAIRRKLLRELTDPVIGLGPGTAAPGG